MGAIQAHSGSFFNLDFIEGKLLPVGDCTMLPVMTPEMIQEAALLLVYFLAAVGAFWTLLLSARVS